MDLMKPDHTLRLKGTAPLISDESFGLVTPPIVLAAEVVTLHVRLWNVDKVLHFQPIIANGQAAGVKPQETKKACLQEYSTMTFAISPRLMRTSLPFEG